jgi:hypothetical protein
MLPASFLGDQLVARGGPSAAVEVAATNALGDQLELLVDDVERLCLRCCRRARAPTAACRATDSRTALRQLGGWRTVGARILAAM